MAALLSLRSGAALSPIERATISWVFTYKAIVHIGYLYPSHLGVYARRFGCKRPTERSATGFINGGAVGRIEFAPLKAPSGATPGDDPLETHAVADLGILTLTAIVSFQRSRSASRRPIAYKNFPSCLP
ncbi:hypothetical protein H1P_1040020 [Hyella patelloides LEGE 07179]|uniref:Uncharacterized protein n=1 Tax=Hyella patelloides LEGE 07179 TaxID=945734 RepID=A0A563VJ14_9CYAN|nr:hypothetical protein H1P_1040020 [Hyella patelloides LEGE 07179]